MTDEILRGLDSGHGRQLRVLLTSHGSTGDIFPLIGLGRALVDAGHEADFASAPLYRREIERAGLGYIHLPPDWEEPIFVEFMRELSRAPHPLLQLRWIYLGGLPFMPEIIERIEAVIKSYDLLVSSYFFPHYRHLAERNGVPFATFAFCHNLVPSEEVAPDGMPRLRMFPSGLQRKWNRLLWRLANWVVDFTVNHTAASVFQKCQLPPSNGFILNPAELAIVAVPQAVAASRRADARFRYTGYLRWQAEENTEMEAQLEGFCGGERVPILTFGSVSFDDTHQIMSRFLQCWPEERKIIIQSGWAGLSVEIGRPGILVIGRVSHDQLFRHASCVIHHGGAGTTASVLTAGVPQIIIPHIADQEFFGAEIERLGVGIKLRRRRWPERLPGKVRRLLGKEHYRVNAAALARELAKENGPANAVTAIEDFLRTSSLSGFNQPV